MFKILLAIAGFFLLVWYYLFRRSRRRMYELAAKIPGPLDWPLIGAIHIGIGRGPTEIFNYLFQYMHTLRSPIRAWFGHLLVILIDEPEHLAVILNSQDCLKKSYVYRFVGFEKGLFNAPPELWRVLRKQLNTSFSNAATKSFVPVFNEKSDNLVSNLRHHVGRGQFDFLAIAGEYSLSTSSVNALGLDLDNDQSDYKKRYLENGEKMFTLKFTRIYKAWLHPQSIYKWTASYREEIRRLKFFQNMSRNIFETRKRMRLTNPESFSAAERDEDNVRRPQLFIERLEKMYFESKTTDDEGVIENLDTFLFASNDTTASLVSTTLLLLAMYQDVQERLFQEIRDTLPNDFIEYEDLAKLTYLDMVLKETMRLIPVVAVVARENEKEIQIGEYTIPANTQIVVPIIKVHRDKNIWGERADEFDPENFSPENCVKRHPYAFIPFSGGIRNCVGIKYAYVSLKIALIKLIKSYKFSTTLKLCDLEYHASMVMRVVNGYLVSIEQRVESSHQPTVDQ
ncbi:probable cytochrome P450 313a4 [Culex pipiens pallens]|uniref:probable cytochrome P450 313a4 n=1 Tax=Culex pipiens pallens TaxID=42434 RepID=UPI001952C62C|nr:probable cytochrome P450 313a4 [Culex pipiens pallens]